MFSRCRVRRYDSFRAARGEMSSLFSPFKSQASLQSAVQRYVLHRSRHLEGLHKSQQRSWVRSKLSLVLHEARQQRRFDVAEAALKVALSEPDMIDTVESTWLKDALACCTTTDEIRQLDATLRAYVDSGSQAMLTGSSSAHPNTAALTRIHTALTAFLSTSGVGSGLDVFTAGGARRGSSREMQLGDNDEAEQDTARWAVATRGAARGDWAAVGDALDSSAPTHGSPNDPITAPSEAEVAQVLAHHAPSAVGQALVAPNQRALNALHRLQRQRDQQAVMPNPSFSRYFVRQGLVRDEAELMALFTALRRRPERLGFRLHLSQPQGCLAQAQLLPGRSGLAPVPWLPPFTGAYTLDCGDAVPYESLLANRRLLQSLAKERVGAYQSLSSMLPVHFLNPQPGDRILDLCASPGGKTTLIYDYLVGAASAATGAVASSCVIANEFVPARAHELALRLQNWSPQIGVTSLRGETVGHLAGEDARDGAAHTEGGFSFNKILVDAPCSGEGRMGREVMAWRLWHPTRSLAYFDRQCALLRRAVALCAAGGTVVYATCTLNPIENEAVVAAVVKAFGAAVRLVAPPPLRSFAPGAEAGLEPPPQLAPGLATWVVPSRAGGFYHTADEASAQGESLNPALFAPGAEETALAEQLRHGCRRVLPHMNPSMDGFFFAVLERTHVRLPTTAPAGRGGVRGEASQAHLTRRWPAGADDVIAASVLGRSSVAASAAPSMSALREKGWQALPAHHPLVTTYLSPFFGEPGTTRAGVRDGPAAVARMAAVLQENELHCVWSDTDGLRVMSGTLLHALTALGRSSRPGTTGTASAASHSSPPALLEAGVLLVNASGVLTESGANQLVSWGAPHRVLSLPLTYFSILLANQRLEVHAGLDGEDDVVREAFRTTSNGLVGTRRGSATASSTGGPALWAGRVLEQVGLLEGNAVVRPLGSGHTSAEEGLLWPVPVQIRMLQRDSEGSQANGAAARIEIKLVLSGASRHRYTAMLGRMRSARARASTASTPPQMGTAASDVPIASSPPGTKDHHGSRPSLTGPKAPPASSMSTAQSEFAFEL